MNTITFYRSLAIFRKFGKGRYEHEIILVDDGSTDDIGKI